MKITLPFEIEIEITIAKACEYSKNPETLRKLLERLEISVGHFSVVPSKWDEKRKLKALHMVVTVNGYCFDYYGSHNDAETMGQNLNELRWNKDYKKEIATLKKRKQDFKESLLYSILCCIGCDYSLYFSEPEEFGMDSDSIKDMAKWNEWKKHSSELRKALRLTNEELQSLPS